MSCDRFSSTSCDVVEVTRLSYSKQNYTGWGVTDSASCRKTRYWDLCVSREECFKRDIGGDFTSCIATSEIYHKATPHGHQNGRQWLDFKLLCNWRSISYYFLETIGGSLARGTNESQQRNSTDFHTQCSWLWKLHLWSKGVLLYGGGQNLSGGNRW